MVVVSPLCGDSTQLIAIIVDVLDPDLLEGLAMIVGTVLQLPCDTFAQALLEIALHTSATHTGIFAYAAGLVLKAQVFVAPAAVENLCPRSVDIVGSLATAAPFESLGNLVIMSPFMTYAPKLELFGVGLHDILQTAYIAVCSHMTGSHESVCSSKEEHTVLTLASVLFQTHHLALGVLHLLVEGHERIDIIRAVSLPCAHGVSQLGVSAAHNDDAVVVRQLGKHSLPVIVGHRSLIPVSAYRSVDEVYTYVGRRLVVERIVVDEDVALALGCNKVQTVAQRV